MEGGHEAPRNRRLRKPRGRGLRTTTGCLTCRKRHKKCDEKQPVCGPCSIASRDCVFSKSSDGQSQAAQRQRKAVDEHVGEVTEQRHDYSQSTTSSLIDPPSSASPTLVNNSAGDGRHPSYPSEPRHTLSEPRPSFSAGIPLHEALQLSTSPADTISSELWSTDFASTRWLGLLATDAAQADSSFSLAPSPAPEHVDSSENRLSAGDDPLFASALDQSLQDHTKTLPRQGIERIAWQLGADAVLTSHEAHLLRHFADHSSRWLDPLEPKQFFSTHATRLALRNTGLMKAILALSAKHRARSRARFSQALPGEEDAGRDDNEWIRYYYETLHYVQEALAYNSYTHSEELLATAIVISAYEMLDEESDGQGNQGNWKRHLKGVFWIQRSQDVNGGSGGLRQSVWWAWLGQDIWAAFREKRACLSFWTPTKDYSELDQFGLAHHSLYLLSQAVNYRADSYGEAALSTESSKTSQKREILLAKMARWKSYLDSEYKPLPAARKPSDIFAPIWIHPPQLGVALQAFSFAQILVTLYSPMPSGFNGYLKMQRSLSECVETICGIAMELTDEGCQVLSAQYLYGAGLCVQTDAKRDKIIELMEACEARVGWAPMQTWREDLRREWSRAEGEGISEETSMR